jgi:hypothetical protein
LGTGGSINPCGSEVSCSGDLHHVVDCNGAVIETCPPEQGCANGTCIPACDAAIENKSSIGCEYYAHNPSTIFGRGCHALFVANTWNGPITISGEAAGSTIDLATYSYLPNGSGTALTLQLLGAGGSLLPGEIAIVFLRDNLGGFMGTQCPMPAAETDPAAGPWTDAMYGTTNAGEALRVTTSAPAVVYDIMPFGGGPSEISDASLLLPTSTWDTNYIGITPRPTGNNTLSPTLTIVGAEDGTTVTLLPSVAVAPGTGVPGGPANQPQIFMLGRGQVLRLEQAEDLLGSIISADKPVGVWGEQQCINIDAYACDAAHEQIPPVRALGSEYVYVRYRDRVSGSVETPPVRITGAVNGTMLTWEPSPMGAQATVDLGQSFEVRSSEPFVVKSQDEDHPFYVAAYMTGGAAYMNRGDPEFVNVIPAAQYLTDYTFFTDPTYPETNLVFVRTKGDQGFGDVTLDCMGVISGWAPIGSSGTYEYTRVDISTGNFMGQNGCDNGYNHAKSDAPFGLTIWGWGTDITGQPGQPGYSQYTSYAYPAGASVQPINKVYVPPVPR